MFLAFIVPLTASALEVSSIDLHEELKSKLANYTNLSFVYEGYTIDLPFDRDTLSDPKIFDDPPPRSDFFQGGLLLRNDATLVLDTFVSSTRKDQAEKILTTAPKQYRQSFFILDNIFFKIDQSENNYYKTKDKLLENPISYLAALNRPYSPFRLLQSLRLLDIIRRERYLIAGTETIEGSECLILVIGSGINKNTPTENIGSLQSFRKYWLCIDKQYIPIRIEDFTDGNVRSRLVNVKAAKYTGKNGEVWLPISADHELLVDWDKDGRHFLKSPNYIEHYHIVRGTVQIDRDLDDDDFKVEAFERWPSTPKLDELRVKYANLQPPPSDPESVSKRMAETLETANSRFEELDASDPTGSMRVWILAAQVALVAMGGALIAFAVLYLRRRS